MAGLEGIDASSMEVIDALGGTRWMYDAGDRIARPVVKHADFLPVAVNAMPGGVAGPQAAGGARVIEKVRFGLPVGPRILTNARSDNLASPAWRKLFGDPAHHALACISYVVEKDGKTGTSYRIQRADGKPIVVPALVDRRHWTFASTGNEYDDLGHVQLTADANPFVATVHGRFVVELADRQARDDWMAPEATGKEALMELLRPAPPERYGMVPIAPDVWTRKGDPEAVKPIGPARRWQEPTPPAKSEAKAQARGLDRWA